MRRRRRRPPRRRRGRGRVLLVLAAFIGLTAAAAAWIRPVYLEYASNTIQHTASFALYDVLTDCVAANPEAYAGLVVLERDENQAVTALQTDGITANQLKVEVSRAVYEAMDTLEQTTVGVPVGTLLAPDWLAGRGPSLPFGLAALGYVQADFISAFSDAGINQTRHQLILEVRAEARVMTLLGGTDVEVTNQLVVSDTVIVGRVPEQYTYIDDTEQSLLGKINDYGSR